jgi:uncharacterized protein with HEPN domain
MSNSVYQYSLETIFEHLQICNKRFSYIENPNDFIATENGLILLDSIVTRLQAIGELVKNTLKNNSNLQVNYPEIDWNNIIRFRDFISHHYEMLDYEIVFEICNDFLPKLENAIQLELNKYAT